MKLNLLDTDTLTLYRRGREPLVSLVNVKPLFEIGTTIITVEEQLTGWQNVLRHPRGDAHLAETYLRLTESVRVLSGMHILTFSEAAIRRYNTLLAMKLNIGKMDLRIAAIALEEDAVVVTRNLRDFGRVPGLACENWAD